MIWHFLPCWRRGWGKGIRCRNSQHQCPCPENSAFKRIRSGNFWFALAWSGRNQPALLAQRTEENIPFIIMTGYAEIQSAVQCMKLGATDYISKPIQPDELLKKSTKPSHSPIKKPKKQKISCCLLPQIFWKEKVKLHNSCSTTYVW